VVWVVCAELERLIGGMSMVADKNKYKTFGRYAGGGLSLLQRACVYLDCVVDRIRQPVPL